MRKTNGVPHDNFSDGRPQAQTRRRVTRAGGARGLPGGDARLDLARTYLETQARLWPQAPGDLPPPSPNTAQRLADEFRERFVGGEPNPLPAAGPQPGKLGAAYLRYSDDNSNPRSLDQQLRNVLERAARDGVFVPWAFVFADAAVTGTNADRRGYQLAKAAVRLAAGGPDVLYVDELGRANRDAVESLQLGRLVESRRKRMVGATDGFDSDSPTSKMQLQVYAMLNEHFVDQLSAKVKRGMGDGFARNKNLGRAALGYRLAPALDASGSAVIGDKGRPLLRKVIDPVGAGHVLECFRLFALEGRSKGRIARRLNELKAGGLDSWEAAGVRQILTRETYVGVEYYGMTRRDGDPETGGVTIVHLPRAQWKRREVPELRVVPAELWDKAQARLAEVASAYDRAGGAKTGPKPGGRTAAYPTVLVRPACAHCGLELWFGSSGRYPTFCCRNGSRRKRGCPLTSYKSVGVVERAVVGRLREWAFTPEAVGALAARANEYLAEEAKRPRGDAAPLRAEAAELAGRQANLLAAAEAGAGDVPTLAGRMRANEARLAELRSRLRDLERGNEAVAPITTEEVTAAVADLHALLKEDPALAAPVLRALTGPVSVRQTGKPGAKSPDWVAEFAVDLVPAMVALSRRTERPSSATWEYLSTSGWKSPESCEVRLGFVPAYETLAPVAAPMADAGMSVPAIAAGLGASQYVVRDALVFARHGLRPKVKSPGAYAGVRTGPPLYAIHAAEVARLRDRECMAFDHIALALAVSITTVNLAYKHAHRGDPARAEARHGRGRYLRVTPEQRRRVGERLGRGESDAGIAAAVGCSVNAVARIRAGRAAG